MGFDVLTFLTRLLGGLQLPGIEEKAATWLAEEGAKYPDMKDRADALAAYLKQTIAEIAPELEPEHMKNTLIGIARDVVSGAAGVDPGAWHGGI